MGTVFKVLLFAFILYFLFTWIRKVFAPTKTNGTNQPNIRIFKKGNIEKPSLDMQDAETVDFEEIKTPKSRNE